MQPFRPRWQDRSGVIIAVAGMSAGMLLCQPRALAPDAATLIAWLVAMLVLAVPFVVLELGVGAIYQDSLGESCRKAGKPWEVVGWLAAGGAALGLLLLVLLGARLALGGYDSLLAAIANQPSPWVANAEDTVAPRGSGEVIAIAVLLGVLQFRLWRGAPAIARSAALMAVIATAGLLLVGGALLVHPGGIDGLAGLLSPATGWSALAGADPWIAAIGMVVVGFACGTGAVTAFGSYLNRSTDAIGLGVVGVLLGAMGQLLLLVVLAIGGGVIVLPGGRTESTLPPAIDTVAGALANSGLPIWWAGVLLTVWFAAVLALVVPALLAMCEAVVAPVVDKFRLPRERVVPATLLAVFFAAAALSVHPHASIWCLHGLLWLLGVTVIAQSLSAVVAVRLDAVARHLNAYSAFHLGWSWRLAVALLMPFAGVALLSALVVREPADALVGGGIAVVVLVVALVVARIIGRNG